MDCENGAGGEDRSKISEFKEEIIQLAALACHEGEEKTRMELLEKFNKSNKDTLVELLRSFDMTGSKANRKEELVIKLMEFLKLHCAGTDSTNLDKINDFKEQILQLAGLAFHEEENSRAELLEKLGKCNKDILVELCRSFNIPGSKANRKEELVTTLMEFLKEHYSGSDATNPDKKTKKRRRKNEGTNLCSGRPMKKKKPDGIALETHGQEEGDDAKCEEDRKYAECNLEGSENECANHEKGQVPKEEASPETSERTNNYALENFDGVALAEVQILTDEQALAKTPSAKVGSTIEGDRIDMQASRKKNASINKRETTLKTDRKEKSCGKQMSRGDAKPRKLAARPSRDELRQAVFFILDTANFATMTFGEVIKEVDKYFGKDLFERKPLIRSLIEEELFRLAEEAEKKELEEEAADIKARAEQTAEEMAKDGVNSDIDKNRDSKSEDAAKNKDGNCVEKGLIGGISVNAIENRNRSDGAESSHDGQCEQERKNEDNGGDFTQDDNSLQDAKSGDHVECSRDCEAERSKKNNNEAIEGSEDGKNEVASTGENDDTKDGSSQNGGKSALNGDDCGAEEPQCNENGENVVCMEVGKAVEAGNAENSENALSHGAEGCKGKEAMENSNTEQSLRDASDDGRTGDAEHNASTEADVDSRADGTTGNGP